MVDRILIDTLQLKSRDFAQRWRDAIRKAPQLRHYNALQDEPLEQLNAPVYPVLSRTLDRGIDRSLVGNFFVSLGKTRMQASFPVSEVIYALNLTQQTVIEYLMTDFVLDNPLRMYQAMGAITRVAEFFILGCFYTTKGFLEATYTHMSKHDAVSEALLKKYFRDDFFFKKD
ncbi:MAG: hypothetical protein LBD74_03260 [Spirochaetaceae bacterium]|jgi:hypothetical protein|nr:hypothetical protein [Spirochaetaceae bacterium]